MATTALVRVPRSEQPAARAIGLHCVVIATDLSPGSDRALRRAAALPYQSHALVVLTHVLPAAVDRSTATVIAGAAEIALERAATRLAGWLARRHRQDVRVQVRLVRGDSSWLEIDRVALAVEADLVCLGRRGQSRLREFVLGTTARRLVRRGSVPVLVVNRLPRGPYRVAVVGIDLSPTSRAASRLARRLVPITGRLTAVHAFEHPLRSVPEPLRPTPDREAKQVTQRELRRRGRRVGQMVAPLKAGGRAWAVRVEDGDPRRILLGAAADLKADLIAVGSAGRSGVNRVLLGSVAEGVLERGPCDVLIVRSGTASDEL